MKLRKPCEHGRYDQHEVIPDTTKDPPGTITYVILCPGGVFLPDDALINIDRDALAAALERRDSWLGQPDTVPMYSVRIEEAARALLSILDSVREPE